jgi:HSP20 family molecular chaperone IbpA
MPSSGLSSTHSSTTNIRSINSLSSLLSAHGSSSQLHGPAGGLPGPNASFPRPAARLPARQQSRTLSSLVVQPTAEFSHNATMSRYTIDIPGVQASDLEVSIHQGILYIKGCRRTYSIDGSVCVKKTPLYKRFPVHANSLDLSQTTARLHRGILTVVGPKVLPPTPTASSVSTPTVSQGPVETSAMDTTAAAATEVKADKQETDKNETDDDIDKQDSNEDEPNSDEDDKEEEKDNVELPTIIPVVQGEDPDFAPVSEEEDSVPTTFQDANAMPATDVFARPN